VTGASDSVLAAVRRIRVGSTNAPKLEAVRIAFEPFAPCAAVEGVAVPSGVPDQPVGFDEIVRGARGRAQAALHSGACDLGVGIEDGLVELAAAGALALNIGCAAITDGRRTSLGFSSAFAYPPACSSRAVAGREPIGELFDALWAETRGERGASPSALSLGNVGRLSLGVMPRSEYARHAVLCALLPLLHPDLYATESQP
jgi:inosine/xanthosine triphosphatase